jgi:ABC-2 type transport system ATP-binding protein
MSNILDVKDLRKEYKGFSLGPLSFQLEPGYITGLIGPNGSGKSTTIKAILGLIRPNGGSIRIFGKDQAKEMQAIKQQIGFVYDQNHFYDEFTIGEMKKVIAGFYEDWDNSLFSQYIDRFNLPVRKKIKEFSKGMKMKFSLAVALSHHARLIIMDEPTSGLDPIFRSELLDLLLEIIQDEEKAIFFSSHITSDLERVADYITFIHNGNLIFSESKDDLLDTYRIVKGGPDLLEPLQEEGLLTGVINNQFGFEALTADVAAVNDRFKGQVIMEKPSLEQIMVHMARGEQYA